jgi:FtsZ-binding cell division protein ZapB
MKTIKLILTLDELKAILRTSRNQLFQVISTPNSQATKLERENSRLRNQRFEFLNPLSRKIG